MAWSTPELIELTKAFVPCADEVWRLQNGADAESLLFQRFSEVGHYRAHKSTRQGIYVVSPNGRLLGSANVRDPDRVAALLRSALDAWRELPSDERLLASEDREALAAQWRWDDEFPEDGLVLEVITRDLPRDGADPGAERRARWTDGAWNRDYAWFRADEAVAWLPGSQPVVGSRHAVPAALVERLVRFHLVDHVRGQTSPFEREHVQLAELDATVRAVTDAEIQLELSGGTRCVETDGQWPRSFETTWEGTATWDRDAGRFTAFELVAVGARSGRTRFNARRGDIEPAPIGVVLRLAPAAAPRIAPTWIHRYGWRRG